MNDVILFGGDNSLGELDKDILKNQNEIMNMNKLIIYDDSCQI